MDNQLIDIDRIPNLTPAQRRDFGMIKQYMESGNWVTSITLAKAMYQVSDLSKKEISKCSSILSKLYHNTTLLQRREKRKIFFQHITGKHACTFAYRVDPVLLKDALKVVFTLPEEYREAIKKGKFKPRQMGMAGMQQMLVQKGIQLLLFP